MRHVHVTIGRQQVTGWISLMAVVSLLALLFTTAVTNATSGGVVQAALTAMLVTALTLSLYRGSRPQLRWDSRYATVG
jgi:hypothetical protein